MDEHSRELSMEKVERRRDLIRTEMEYSTADNYFVNYYQLIQAKVH